MHRLQRVQWLAGTLETVFPFFEDPANLKRITPPWLGFDILDMSTPAIQQGTRITYRVRWLGLPLRWVTLIEAWEPPLRFVDVALVSPYCLWHHEHRFEPLPEGVLMHDTVQYRLPFGPAGDLIHRLMIRRQLEKIFDYRARVAAVLFAGGIVRTAPPQSQSPSDST